jgi:hypothetical protein
VNIDFSYSHSDVEKVGGNEGEIRDCVTLNLFSIKVPKCEIFDLFDFNDFYVMKFL